MKKQGQSIVISDGENVEVWGSLTELCKAHGITYHYLKARKYPFEYRGVTFKRIATRHKPETGHVIFEGK